MLHQDNHLDHLVVTTGLLNNVADLFLTTPRSLESFPNIFVMTLLIPRKTVVIISYHGCEEVLVMVSTMIIPPMQSDHNHLLTPHYQTYEGPSSTSTLKIKLQWLNAGN